MFDELPDVIKIEQLCKMLHIGKKTAYDLVKGGKIPYRRIGKQYRIRKDAVIAYLKETG